MVENILKLTIQKEKTKYFGFKYSKIAVKNGATPIFAAIIAPTVGICSVSDPDPHGSALKFTLWIRIRIRDADSGSGCSKYKITKS